MKLAAAFVGALVAGYVVHFAWNWESDQAGENEAKEPDATPLRDRVAEQLAGAAAGQAAMSSLSVVAAAEAICAHEAQATQEFPAVDPLAGREKFKGPEDIS